MKATGRLELDSWELEPQKLLSNQKSDNRSMHTQDIGIFLAIWKSNCNFIIYSDVC